MMARVDARPAHAIPSISSRHTRVPDALNEIEP